MVLGRSIRRLGLQVNVSITLSAIYGLHAEAATHFATATHTKLDVSCQPIGTERAAQTTRLKLYS